MEAAGFHHPFVRAARALHVKKHRAEQRCFLIEGPTAVGAALDSPALSIERIFARADEPFDPSLRERAGARDVSIVAVDERSMRSLSQTQQPQGIVAVGRFFHRELDALGEALPSIGGCVVLVLHAIADPGNAGTLVRSAEAFGAAAVCWGAASVDPYNEKVARASMGSLFHVPLFTYDGWDALAGAAQRLSLDVVGAQAGAPDVRAVTIPARSALVIGHERHGLASIPASAGLRVGIPQAQRAESLNAAVAGSIVLYEIARSAGVLGTSISRTKVP